MYCSRPYLPVKDELGSAGQAEDKIDVGVKRKKKKAKDKKEIEEEKLWQVGLITNIQ